MKKLMLLTGLLAFLLFSCDGLFDGPGGEKDPIDEDGVAKKSFKAQSFKNGSFYSLEAGKLAEGTNCTVWVERGAGIDKETAQKVANEYSNNIHQKMISAFGTNTNGFNFTTELADINSAQGGKLLILLLDIRDNYQKGVNESSVGGYFLWSDLFTSEANSNGLAMIYIDTSPGVPGSSASNMTLAHEMQHLINEITSQTLRATGSNYDPMELWIDEGLSCAAEWVYSGSHPQNRWGWYHNNGNGTNIKSDIDKGNNFYVWGNRAGNPYAEIDDYATAYLFFQWLRIQSGSNAIYKDIIGSTNADYRAVTSAAAKFEPSYNNNWGGLLRDWLAANYINSTSTSSRYGYKNDTTLKGLNSHLLTSGTSTGLYPGEGVFSKIDQAYVTAGNKPNDAGNIKYSILTSTAPQDALAVGALLTYNTNTANAADSPSVPGTVTGASISVNVSVDGRFVSPPVALSGPYWVSGGDVLRRNGSLGLPPAGVPRPSIRVAR